MKKCVFLITLAILFCLLCACDPGSHTIDQTTLSNVDRIELIRYQNPSQKHFTSWVPDQFDKLVPFDSKNATVLETLPAEKNSEFLETFSQTDILHTYYAYDSPADICLRLNYENGDFLIIWANYSQDSYAGYIGEYASDGTVLSFWGSFSALDYYTDLVDRFFTTPLQ